MVLLIALLLAGGALFAQTPVAWWEAEPLRIVHVVTSLGRIDFEEPATLAAQKAAQGYNAEHFEVMPMPAGLDDAGWYFRSKVASSLNRDYLKEYLPEAKKRGLRVLIYFNVHWFNQPFAARRPDWVQVRENGKPLTGVYDTGTDFCFNSPWREWVFNVLRELMSYPIDGIFFDGPIFFPDTCYCRYCQAKYQERYKQKLPSKSARKGRDFRNLIEFQAASMADFLRESRAIIKRANPNAVFYMNGGVRGGNWATARLNRVLVNEQDMLGSEGGFISGDLTRVPVWKPGITARLLETQAGGKPRIIFSAAGHKPWTFSLLTAPELRLLYAGSIANAAGVWFGMTPFEFRQPEMQALAAMNRFVEKNASYLHNTRSAARAALVWSDTSANFYAGSDAQMIDVDRVKAATGVGNLDNEFSGLAEALLRCHLPFDVIDDTALEREDISRYQVIFLPNVACMSDAVAARLREYVRRGGNLFATFETSLYDDTGVRRAEFALADVFGVASAMRIFGPRRWDYTKRVQAHPLASGLDRELLPSPIHYLRVTAKGAQTLLVYSKPLAGRYDGIPGMTEDPALTIHAFGKGKAAYASGDLGATIQGFRIPELFRTVRNAVTVLSEKPVQLDGAPASVEVVLRSQEDGRRHILHLLNSTAEMTRPIERIIPLSNIRARVKAAPGSHRVFTLLKPQELQARVKEGFVEFTIPRVEEYEVVVIEKR